MFKGRFFRKIRLVAVSTVTAAVIGCSSVAGAAAFREGDQGNEIVEIQAKLADMGYDIAADGDFGPATLAAVKEFQKKNNLEIDGLIGPSTYRELMGRPMPEIKVSRGNASTSTSRRLVSNAMRHLGTGYVFGGTSPSGFDCSGYVQYVFASVGIHVPRTADVQFEVGTPIPKRDLRAGDMVFFSTYEPGPSHVGIYLGDGTFIHASSGAGHVTITPLDKPYYAERYLGARRV